MGLRISKVFVLSAVCGIEEANTVGSERVKPLVIPRNFKEFYYRF